MRMPYGLYVHSYIAHIHRTYTNNKTEFANSKRETKKNTSPTKRVACELNHTRVHLWLCTILSLHKHKYTHVMLLFVIREICFGGASTRASTTTSAKQRKRAQWHQPSRLFYSPSTIFVRFAEFTTHNALHTTCSHFDHASGTILLLHTPRTFLHAMRRYDSCARFACVQ